MVMCECMNWARDGSQLTPFGHHQNCSKYQPIKVYRVVLKDCGFNACIETTLDGAMEWVGSAEVGDTVIIQVLEMDKEGFESLSEFQGP